MLVRTVISRKLRAYYAQPSSSVVGSVPSTIDFRALWGEWHWMRRYQRLYEEQEGQWLTPVELFQPYYSNVLANFVQCHARSRTTTTTTADNPQQQPVEIVELGGGRGSNACFLLDHIQRSDPELYDRVGYTIIDASSSLLSLQEETIHNQGHHRNKVNFRQMDLTQAVEQSEPIFSLTDHFGENTNSFVLALELLDNLPHDKIRVRQAGHIIEQAQVRCNLNEAQHEEYFAPLSDPLLQRILKLVPSYTKLNRTSPVAWVPTVACGLLEQLAHQRPHCNLVIADFDWLPPPNRLATNHRISTWADGEPIVTDMNDMDHECYLVAPELCDILFPTNFRKLAGLADRLWKRSDPSGSPIVSVRKQAEFLHCYGSEQVAQTKSWITGYTPLLQDFVNCSVLTITPNESNNTHDNIR